MKGKLEREEIIAVAGGAILAIGVFLAWYKLDNRFASIGPHGPGRAGLTLSAWKALSTMRYVLLVGAASPLILAYIVIRGHALSWPRGELTAVVAIIVVTLVLLRGLIVKPGDPAGQISLQLGWVVALVGSILMLGGAVFHRARNDTGPRKPPGVP